MTLTILVRIALTIFLMFIVWSHAHWSVALSLTLMAISIELMVFDRGPRG